MTKKSKLNKHNNLWTGNSFLVGCDSVEYYYDCCYYYYYYYVVIYLFEDRDVN